MSDLYFEDLVQEIERLNSQNPDGFTSYEMAKAVDKSQAWCRRKIRALIEMRRVEFVGQKKVERADKRIGVVPVYRIIPGESA